MSGLIVVGELSFWIALLTASWAAVVSCAGGRMNRRPLVESGERAVSATFGLLAFACAGLVTALLARDFSLRHVALYSAANLPARYTISALWAGMPGSLLFSTAILAGYSVIAVRSGRPRPGSTGPYLAATLAAATLLLLVLLAVTGGPFQRLAWVPPEGVGLLPRLQSALALVHLPALHFGHMATAVPFALAVAGLRTEKMSAEEMLTAARWASVAWLLITAGILIGMWWTYRDPAASERWPLSPIESGSLFSWLALTAFLFFDRLPAARESQVSRAVVLLLAALPLAILATFAGLSSPGASARSFTQSLTGALLTAAVCLFIAGSGLLVVARTPLRTDGPTGSRSASNHRSRLLGLAGLGFLAVAVAASPLRRNYQVTIDTGEAVELRDAFGRTWELASEGISRYESLNRHVLTVTLSASRDDQRAGLLATGQRQHFDSRGAPTHLPSVETGTLGSPFQDVQAALIAASDSRANLRISFIPLVRLIWAGGLLLIGAGVGMLWSLRQTARAQK